MLPAADAIWICRLMDANVATFTGTVVDVPSNFRSGDSVILSLTASLRRSAFTDPNAPASSHDGVSAKKSFFEDNKETDKEKGLRERKAALNQLFSRVNLLALVDLEAGEGKVGQLLNKREMLEKYEGARKGDEEEEGKEIAQDRLGEICEFACEGCTRESC